MEEKEIVQTLQDMRFTHAPKALHEKVRNLADSLPVKHSGFYFPLFTFQMVLAGLLVVVLVGIGSGVVLAAKGSMPGTPLYRVREFLQHVAPTMLHDESAAPTPLPTGTQPSSATPMPTKAQERHSIQGVGNEREHEAEGEDAHKNLLPTMAQKEVEGIHTQANNAHQDGHDNGENKQENILQKFFDK